MVTGPGGSTCPNCGQANSGNGQFCVRCGDRLPGPSATTVGATGTAHPWEPPAEWNPHPSWNSGSTGAPAPSWDENSRTWGPGVGTAHGAPAAHTPPPAGYPQAAPQQGPTYQGTPPPGHAATPPAGSGGRRNRTPLFAGLGALVVVALVVIGIVLATAGGKDDGPRQTTVALNGEETKPPSAVLDDTRVNLRTTSGVHAAGTITSEGDNIRMDLDFAGANAKGILTISGNDVQIIRIGDEVYMKGDRDFYLSVANGDQKAVDAIGNKWLKATGDDAQEFSDFSLDSFADAFKVNDGDAKLNPTLGREAFDAQPVVVLTQTDGSRLLVANTGKAYPLRLEKKSATDGGQIDFTNFDQPVAISAPPTNDVLDLSQLG